MYSSIMALILAILALDAAVFVNAGIYVFNPLQGATCRAGQPCTIEWVDDGTRPLLGAIGITTVGLYHGKQQLVQSIPAVDVSGVRSLTFTPIAAAGPSSDTYYISFTATNLQESDGSPYQGFSPSFKLEGMTGSFDTPLPSATSLIPIPSSLSHAHTASISVPSQLSTILPPLPSIPSSSSSRSSAASLSSIASSTPSGFSTAVVSSSSASQAAAATSPPASNVATGSIPSTGLAAIGAMLMLVCMSLS
ncbi:hypothetical protein BDQ12DRAFT_530188 [Crucibulum laeve]|uniref:Yeast cell wall synthesis Kre9/Knh1-like N-terminal domain-containing protein n=1 Tax=Crucibulum laeve TaxID=68775 RepID=A0A5C3LHB8_9AGAR|nr:hypothetical protein BDQ12DRAFT_530188 [Crucibulum laeve]